MQRSVRIDFDLDLRRTLRFLSHGPGTQRHTDQGVAMAMRTPLGPGTIHVQLSNDRVEAEAWGRGAEWLLDRLPDLVGAGDDMEGFRPDERIAAIVRRRPGLRFGRTSLAFEPALDAIIGQKVPGPSAKKSFLSLARTYGDVAPGPIPLLVPPSPQRLAGLPYEAYHPHNLERKRADTIRAAAHRAPRLEEAASMAPDDAVRRIMAFPGIGIWTATCVVQVALGDPDTVIVGDYNMPDLVAWNLAGKPRGDDELMLELLEPYAGHRARVVRLLKAGGRRPPRYGPRLSLVDISKR